MILTDHSNGSTTNGTFKRRKKMQMCDSVCTLEVSKVKVTGIIKRSNLTD